MRYRSWGGCGCSWRKLGRKGSGQLLQLLGFLLLLQQRLLPQLGKEGLLLQAVSGRETVSGKALQWCLLQLKQLRLQLWLQELLLLLREAGPMA